MSVRRHKAERSVLPITQGLPGLLASHDPKMSVLQLAKAAAVSASHLSRALRETDGKTVGADLAARIAAALGKPHDFFPEYRRATVIEALRDDQALCDRIYDELGERPASPRLRSRRDRPRDSLAARKVGDPS